MKRRGFTLAEVLITLGIIGVVAAITMPTLMADTKYKQVGVKLAKFHNNLENSARAYAADRESIENADDFQSFINQSYVFKDIYSTTTTGEGENAQTSTTNGGTTLAATAETNLLQSKGDFSQNYAILKDDTKIAFAAAAGNDINTTKYPDNKYGSALARVYFNPNIPGLSANAQQIYTFAVTTNGHVVPSAQDRCTEELFQKNWIVKKEDFSAQASTEKDKDGNDKPVAGACYRP